MPFNIDATTVPANGDFAKGAAEEIRGLKQYIVDNLRTALQLLNAIKTVDGAGSGLDADLLDNLSSAAFAQLAAATNTFTGNAVISGALDVGGILGTESNSDLGSNDNLDTHTLRGATTLTTSLSVGTTLGVSGTATVNALASTTSVSGASASFTGTASANALSSATATTTGATTGATLRYSANGTAAVVGAGRDATNGMFTPAANILGIAGNGIETARFTNRTATVGATATTETATVSVGGGRTGSGISTLDLIGDSTQTGLSISRAAGLNSASSLTHAGTGALSLIASGAAAISFQTAATVRGSVASNGQILSNLVGSISVPNFSFSGALTTGIFQANSTVLSIAGNGIETARFNARVLTVGPDPINQPCSVDIGGGRTGSGNSDISLIGDATNVAYGTRLIRTNAGANANSELLHRGTGPLRIVADDLGAVSFATQATDRFHVTAANGQLTAVGSGTAAAPRYSFDGFLNNGLYQTVGNFPAISSAGVESMRFSGRDPEIGTAASTQQVSLTLASGRTGNGNSIIDLIGDATNTDYGLRLIRGNTGANATSLIQHRGTGALRLEAQVAAPVSLQNSIGSVTLDTVGRFSGTDLHNNSSLPSGAATNYVASGTYTPTVTLVTNTDTLTPTVTQWIRVGNVVTVAGTLTANFTNSGAVNTVFEFALPIASTLDAINRLGGACNSNGTAEAFSIIGDTINNRARFQGASATNTDHVMSFTFTYVVL